MEKTVGAPAQEKKEERKDSRFERRLKARKIDILNAIVNRYMSDRTYATTPEEEETVYKKYRQEWFNECDKFNKSKNRPFTLRYETFQERVKWINDINEKKEAETREKALNRATEKWLKTSQRWRSMFFKSLWYWITCRGDKKAIEAKWRVYYATQIYKTHE